MKWENKSKSQQAAFSDSHPPEDHHILAECRINSIHTIIHASQTRQCIVYLTSEKNRARDKREIYSVLKWHMKSWDLFHVFPNWFRDWGQDLGMPPHSKQEAPLGINCSWRENMFAKQQDCGVKPRSELKSEQGLPNPVFLGCVRLQDYHQLSQV